MDKKIIIFLILLLSINISFSITSWTRACTSCGNIPSCGSSHVSRTNNCGGCDTYYEGNPCSAAACAGYTAGSIGSLGITCAVVNSVCFCDAHSWSIYDDECFTLRQNSVSGSVTCTCDANYGNCDGDSENCETWTTGNPNACGSSCSTCSDAPCVSGSCQTNQEWARVKVYCNTAVSDSWEGTAGTSGEYRKDNDGSSYSSAGNNVFCGSAQSYAEYYGYGKCSTGYKDCNGGGVLDGCEVDIRHFNTACGGCIGSGGVSCNTNNQWCWQGDCISKIGEDFTHGTCSGGASSCPANSVVDISGDYGENTCAWSGSPKCNCNSGYKNCDGVAGSSCEIQVSADINNCGACGRVCSTWLDTHNSAGEEVSTLAESGQCSDYKLGGSKSMCQYSCNSGSCSALSLSRGQCDNPGETTQCVSGKTCIESITDLSANIDSGRSWCCSSTQCSYNGVCYEEGAMIHDIGANSLSYFCSSSYKWTLVGTNLNLSRMISQPRSNLNINKINYFSDLGVANTCSGGSACVISGPKYSYKYCFSYNIVFDGMFNIETNNNVPVKVSEQDLYNPYFRPVEIIPTNTTCITPEGTNEDTMYCAVKP